MDDFLLSHLFFFVRGGGALPSNRSISLRRCRHQHLLRLFLSAAITERISNTMLNKWGKKMLLLLEFDSTLLLSQVTTQSSLCY